MRLLVLTNLFPNTVNAGGAFVEERVRAYRRLGADVRGVALTLDYGRVGALLSRVPGRQPPRLVPPSLLSASDVPFSPAHRLAVQRPGPPRDWALRRVLRGLEPHLGERPDLVVGHGMYQLAAGRLAREVATSRGVPYSVTLHGGDVTVDLRRRPAEFRSTLLGAGGTVFVSDALRRATEDVLGPLPRTLVCGNGYDPEHFFPPPGGRPKHRGPQILYVGRLAPVKGADRLPAIFGAVAAAVPSARFRVVGDGPLERTVRAGTQGLDVSWTGRLGPAGVGRAMREADLLVVPSRSEGWPAVIHEAQACGLPVVASDVGGVREALHSPSDLVQEGPGVVERFAAAALRRLRDPWAPDVLGRTAAAHTWERVARGELDFYARLL